MQIIQFSIQTHTSILSAFLINDLDRINYATLLSKCTFNPSTVNMTVEGFIIRSGYKSYGEWLLL